MQDSSPSIHRRQKEELRRMQSGTILSFTTLTHAPSKFGQGHRIIGLIELADGSKVMAPLTGLAPEIGMEVVPRMRLSFVTEEALRVYETAYEVMTKKPVKEGQVNEFPGYILALTGPSGVGKSTLSRMFVSMMGEARNVPIVTTRGRRKGDDGEYRYVSKKEFERLRASGEMIAATMIPSRSEDRWYGYRATDIQKIWASGMLPVVITEMHLLEGLSKHFGRRSILSFGILPPGKSKRAMLSHLLHRLRSRGRDTEESIKDRLENAEKDLSFFRERSDLFDHLVVNEDLNHVIQTMRKQVPGLSDN